MTAKEPFFLFGMGNRRKLLYRAGEIIDARTQERLMKWDVSHQLIKPYEFRVELTLKGGANVVIFENENGVYLETGDDRPLPLTESPVHLPSFAEFENPALMRALLGEMLINIVDGRPLPNLFVYESPWYRDAAMVTYALSKTGNIDLVKDWVLQLDEVYDRNNGGHEEADNIGQVLVMLALCGATADDPLVGMAVSAAKRLAKNGYIEGVTDMAPHAYYQTGWLKWGLELLGLPDDYEYPLFDEEYAPLFWMNDSPRDSINAFDEVIAARFPAMKVAELHYYEEPIEANLLNRSYPITWESHAPEANYSGMKLIDAEMSKKRYAAPHAGHAAELLLYLLEGAKLESV